MLLPLHRSGSGSRSGFGGSSVSATSPSGSHGNSHASNSGRHHGRSGSGSRSNFGGSVVSGTSGSGSHGNSHAANSGRHHGSPSYGSAFSDRSHGGKRHGKSFSNSGSYPGRSHSRRALEANDSEQKKNAKTHHRRLRKTQ